MTTSRVDAVGSAARRPRRHVQMVVGSGALLLQRTCHT